MSNLFKKMPNELDLVILTDCLSNKVDEGGLKVTKNLIKRIKKKFANTYIISYKRTSVESNVFLNLNKLFLNKSLLSFIRELNVPLLYIPSSSNTFFSILRIFILSIFYKNEINVLFYQKHKMLKISKLLLKLSHAKVIVLSKESYEYYHSIIGDKVFYLKTGVDILKFLPVNNYEKINLRKKYDISIDKKILLHVGHLKKGRNIDKFLNIDNNFHILLVISSYDKKNLRLMNKLNSKENITIIDKYIENIEQIYQLSDAYIFPVCKKQNCIDIPLSVLEALSCNVPVITTNYGELNQLIDNNSIKKIESFEKEKLNNLCSEITNLKNINSRSCVLDYDWNISINNLLEFIFKSR